MKKTLAYIHLGPLLLSLLTGLWAAPLENLPESAPTDRSEHRRLVLDNGLRVILLSDPDLNRSSASVTVDVGSYMDPEDRHGLAHFVEHMLFLGTEKYPSEAEYGNYIRANGGFTNAYVAGDHTNYRFEVGHHAFEGAIDRFSQFFIAPLFLEEFIERELNVVHAEFEGNLENDFRRILQILTHFYNPDHPANTFGTGNLNTLRGIQREEFVNFYKEFYSANQMALALTGTASLDQLEAWARQYFSDIPTTGRDPLSYPSDMIHPSDAVRWIRVEPVRDVRELQIVFGLEGTRHLWPGKSPELIGELVGHEGPGSLLSYLKERGWATSLGSGFWENSRDFSQVFVIVGLTPEGQEHAEDVLEAFFAYVDMLRHAEYPGFLFREKSVMARLEELYGDKGEGASRAAFLSTAALQYPLEVAERIPYLYVAPDIESYYHILDQFQPEKALVLEVARGVETEKVEPIYGSHYGYSQIRGDLMERLKAPRTIGALALPPPNPYIPVELEQLDMHPVPLVSDAGAKVYYLQDLTFERPQVKYIMRVRTPERLATARQEVLREFFLQVLSEVTNEEIYLASRGGASAGFSGNLEGIRIEVSGYSGSAEALLEYVLEALEVDDFPEARFEALRERRLRDLRNFALAQAYLQARELQRKRGHNRYFTPADKLSYAASVTLQEVLEFGRQWRDSGRLEMLIHGNVSPARAREEAYRVIARLDLRPLGEDEVFRSEYRRPEGGSEAVQREQIDANNSCFWQEVVLGEDSPRNRAKAMVVSNFISEPYFSEMRTRQQLGYIVWSFTTRRFQDLVAGFVIQSPDFTAAELQERSDKLVQNLPDMLRDLEDEAFASLVAGVESTLRERDKSIDERAGNLFERAFTHGGDWNRSRETLRELGTLTREETADWLQQALDPASSHRLTVLTFARQHAMDEDA